MSPKKEKIPMNNPQIFSRQTSIIDPEKLKIQISLIGAGSVGSWTALALSKLGCSNLYVYDGDRVEVHNAGSQIYHSTDEEEYKVIALQEKLNLLTDMPIIAHPYNVFMPDYSKIIISAVDSMSTRKRFFEQIKTMKGTYFIDARMGGDVIEIYSINSDSEEDKALYEKTLFDDKDAAPVLCSARSVVYNVFVCAGLIADIVAKIANEQPPPP